MQVRQSTPFTHVVDAGWVANIDSMMDIEHVLRISAVFTIG